MPSQKTKFALFLEAQRKEIQKYLLKHFWKKSRKELSSEWVKLHAKEFREKYYKKGLIKKTLNYIKVLWKKLLGKVFNV